ncbi:hypothetical protein M758_1G144100 [Ceratodon purpureus]|nr:hypothetical protein M758_1G144100 [Ceratodon purpureus]
MNWDEIPEGNDLRRRFLSDSDIFTELEDKEDTGTMDAAPLLDRNDSRGQAPVRMAAALVEQAMEGRWMPVEVTYHKNFESAKNAFLWYHRLYIPRAICILALVALPFFEIPVWCQGQLPYPCGDPVTYQLSGLPYIDRWQSLLVESLCLIMLMCSVALQFYYLGSHFSGYSSAIIKVVLLTALIISAAASAAGVFEAFQLSMYLRVLVPVVFTRSLRVCFRVTIRIVHTFADIAVLLGLFILLSAYFATSIFRDAISEYEDYRTSLLNLFVLLTTANNPNVWADAYTADRRAFFFFFTYLVVGLFFLMNLVFTVIYDNYKAQMATEAEKRITARQQSLRAAFVMLDTKQQEWIDGAKITALLNAISSYSQIPDSSKKSHEVFLALDRRGDFRIWKDEFDSFCDVVANAIERLRHQHRVPRSRAGEILEHIIITEPVYDQMIWGLTLASVVVAICESEVTSNYIKNRLAIPEIVLGWIFVLDVLVKMSVIHGWTKYWRISLNQFDFLLTFLTTITQVAVFFHLIEQHWVSILFLVRGLRICCFIEVVSRWHLMAQTVVHLIPATAPILALQFIVCTLFSLLGVHLFGGKVYLGNRLLEDTDYAAGRLYAFNYNDYASAMVTSFNLCIVNNWYVIMDAYAVVTGTAWSRVFFLFFWAVAVAFTLNVVVAFFVESFVFRMEQAKTDQKKYPAPSRSRSRSESPRRGRSPIRRPSRMHHIFSCQDLDNARRSSLA